MGKKGEEEFIQKITKRKISGLKIQTYALRLSFQREKANPLLGSENHYKLQISHSLTGS